MDRDARVSRTAATRGRPRPRPARASLLAAGLLLLACTGEAGPPPTGEPIRIGAVYSTTGGMKWFDLPGLNGFRLAADQVNRAGGVLGRPLEVVHADGTTDPSATVEAVREMIAEHPVVAIGGLNEGVYALAPLRGALPRADGGLISFSHSELARLVAPVAQRAGVPIVSASSTLPTLPDQIGDRLFLMSAGTEVHVQAIVDHAYDVIGARSAWVLTDVGYDFARTLASSFERRWGARGGTVALRDEYQPSRAYDISEQLIRLATFVSPPDVLFLASLPNDLGHLMDQIRDAGVTRPVVTADIFETPYIPAFAEENAHDLFFSTDLSLDDPRLSGFVDAYEDAYGRAPEHTSAAFGYECLMLIAHAIRAAGAATPDAITAALAATRDFDGLAGAFSYPAGSRVPVEPTTLVRLDRGRYVFLGSVEARAS